MSDRPVSNSGSGSGSASGSGRSSGGSRGGSSAGSGSRGASGGNSGARGGSGGSQGGYSGGSRGGSSGGSGGRPSGGRPGGSSGGRSANSSGSGRPPASGDRPDNKFQRAGQADRAPGLERPRVQAPELPEGVTGAELDADVQAELRSLTKANADDVGAHLAATALLLDEDPEAAYKHATYAKARASRVGSVREAVGIAAYMTGRYAEALSELRAVKRIHGSDVHLPVMADCQRGLGRPERALEMAGSPEAAALDVEGQVEMRIVAAGARTDLGQLDAAALTLQCPQLRDAKAPWAARLRYAYAEALLAAGRLDEGREWMGRAVEADSDASTDAAERLAELEGVTFFESAEDESDDVEDAAAELVAPAPTARPEDAPPFDGEPVDTGSRGPVRVSEPAAAVEPIAAPESVEVLEPVEVPEPTEPAPTPAIPEVVFTEAPSAPEVPDDDPDAHPTLF